MDEKSVEKYHDENAGVISWIFPNGGKVKLVDSPCYKHDIKTCREYGELRLLPDLTLQKCIFSSKTVSIKDLSDAAIKEMIITLWESFTKCL
jgi:cyclic pyranopterin phosphate synthase